MPQLPVAPKCLSLSDKMLVVGGEHKIHVYNISGCIFRFLWEYPIPKTIRSVAISEITVAWTVQDETETGFCDLNRELRTLWHDPPRPRPAWLFDQHLSHESSHSIQHRSCHRVQNTDIRHSTRHWSATSVFEEGGQSTVCDRFYVR